jgi:SAM-dependent methyltransferase
MSFKDHFSGHADDYARFRPTYPATLFAWLAEQAPGHGHAWDCGTGNGQSARGLAAHFAAVTATDPSAEQIRNAFPHPRVTYRVAPAEDPGLAAASVDLVTVAQALHWFDLPRFFAQAARVLRPGGVLAAWCYGLVRVSPAVDPLLERLYDGTVGPYWPPERALVDEEYRSLAVPDGFVRVEAPAFVMEQAWTLDDLLGYLGTWSAVKRYAAATGEDPVAALAPALAGAWEGDPGHPRPVCWTLRPWVVRRQ